MASTIGQRYELGKVIGTGGMGRVYRAVDRLTGQTVALKQVLAPVEQITQLADDSQHLRLALAREFQTLASLRHPNIIGVLDYGFDSEGQPYFTMELVENPTNILEAGAKLPRTQQVELLVGMLQALAYLHWRDILHHDLKPSNVLVSEGQVKVLDFGLSVTVEQAKLSSGTSGTLAYLAPEVLMGEPAGITADLYAVGVIAYELFLGKHPFNKNSVSKLMKQVLEQPPDFTNVNLEPPLIAVLQRLLGKNPNDRYNSAPQVIEALSSAMGLPLPLETQATRESFLQAAQLVGREAEMAQMAEVLRQALDGTGSAWVIGGESGIGKSRLLDELRPMALVQGALVMRSQTVSEGGAPYQPWRDALRWLTMLSHLSDEEASSLKPVVPDIAALLGREVADPPESDPKTEQEQLFATIVAMVKQQIQPIAIMIEDLHWAGQESLMLFARLASLTADQAFLLVGNYRNDERADLPSLLPGVQVLALQRLDEPSTAVLIESMLGSAGRNHAVLDLLQRETEGNIFFLIEIIRTLAEEVGQLGRIGEQALPQSMFVGGMRRIIMRRLERVPDWARPLLRAAAIIGRQLDLALLRQIDPAIDLEQWLLMGTNAAVLDVQDNRWRFAHDKLREGLLDNFDANEKRSLHRRVAEAIEVVYPNAPEQTAALAYHWQMAGDTAKEAQYTILAGDMAFRLYALSDAMVYYRRALELVKDTASNEQLIHLHTRLGRSLELRGQHKDALKVAEEMSALAQQRGDRRMELAAVLAIALLRSVPGPEFNVVEGKRLLEWSLNLARELNDRAAEARILWNLMILNTFSAGDPTQTLPYGEQAQALARELNLRELLAYTLHDLALVYWTLGRFDPAYTVLVEARGIWEELGNFAMLSDTLGRLSLSAFFIGDYDLAAHFAEEAYRIGAETGSVWSQSNSRFIAGFMCYEECGDFAKTIEVLQESIHLAQQCGNLGILIINQAALGWLYVRLGVVEPGLKLLSAASQDGLKFPHLAPWAMALHSRAYLRIGDKANAEAKLIDSEHHLTRNTPVLAIPILVALAECELAMTRHNYLHVIELLDRLPEEAPLASLRPFSIDRLYARAMALIGLGKMDEAYSTLCAANAEAEELGERRMRWLVLFELSQLEVKRGNKQQAQALLQQACDTVMYIADHLDADLRDSFLAQPDVRRVIGNG